VRCGDDEFQHERLLFTLQYLSINSKGKIMISPAPFELSLSRTIDATPEQLFRAWTEPELMKQWFCPKPWRVTHAEIDARTGGANFIVMQGPEGQEHPNRGVYLEIIPNRKIVFTDAFTEAWVPSEKPFMTGVITFEPLDGGSKTLYTAKALHWSAEDMETHEQMGFHEGWGIATGQLAALFAS
jgi:uncharacterized protein YndB with AHSA1/START domain